MKSMLLLKKLRLENKEFFASDEIRAICASMGLDYDLAIRYLLARGYMIRIFRGIFYVKTADETELGKVRYNPLTLVAKGIEVKGVKPWYFGLHSALKLNNMTHEYFTVDEIVSACLFRASNMLVAGHRFKFYKFSKKLLVNGIIEENGLRYSSPEKTILDFIYLWRYNSIPREKIMLDVSEWLRPSYKAKISSYARDYPNTVAEIAAEIIT